MNGPDDIYKEELEILSSEWKKVLKGVNTVLEKYNAKTLWRSDLAHMKGLKEELIHYTSILSTFLNMVSMGSIGRAERQMGDIRDIRIEVNGTLAHLLSASTRENSVLTIYADDDKAVWRKLRRRLVEDGLSSSTITEQKQLILVYIKQLVNGGLLHDELEDLPKAASIASSKMESEMPGGDLSEDLSVTQTGGNDRAERKEEEHVSEDRINSGDNFCLGEPIEAKQGEMTMSTFTTSPPTLQERIESLRCANAEGRYFVPAGALEKVLTIDAVQFAVRECGIALYEYHQQHITSMILKGGRKVFAILTMLDEQTLISKFLQNDKFEWTKLDSNLPYAHSALELIMSRTRAWKFHEIQWEFIAPVFKRGMPHYTLSDDVILPFVDEQIVGVGPFSTARALTIHPDHCDLARPSHRQPHHERETGSEISSRRALAGIRVFRKECRYIENANQLRKRSPRHPNIIELLGSYSTGNKSYLLFPMVDGTLSQLLESNEPPSQLCSEAGYLFALCGLSSAIKTLHYLNIDVAGSEPFDVLRNICPSQILMDRDRLMLLHPELSKPNSEKDISFFNYNEYAAPETRQISRNFRASDIWSFGCVIAEIAIYMSDGPAGVEEFRDLGSFQQDHWIHGRFPANNAVNPGVTEWLGELKTKTSRSGVELLDLITAMLRTKPTERPNMVEVTRSLRCLALSTKARAIHESCTKIGVDLGVVEVLAWSDSFRIVVRVAGIDTFNDAGSHSFDLFESDPLFDQWDTILADIAEQIDKFSTSRELSTSSLSTLRALEDNLVHTLPNSLKAMVQAESKNFTTSTSGRESPTFYSQTSFVDSDYASNRVYSTLDSSIELEQAAHLGEQARSRVKADDEIQSIASDQDETEAQESTGRIPQAAIAIGLLATLFAENNELSPLYEEALSLMEVRRFVNDFQRLLRQCYLDLRRNAKGNLEVATCLLLKGQERRTRIAARIAGLYQPENDETSENTKRQADEDRSRASYLERWIADNQGLGHTVLTVDTPGPVPDDILQDREEDSSEEDGSEDENGIATKLPHISEMESFITGSDAFQTLVTNFRIFLLPTSLRSLARVIMSVPTDRIKFVESDDLSISNKMKIFVESITEENWNWWPLRAKMKRLQKDQTRLLWQCVSDTSK